MRIIPQLTGDISILKIEGSLYNENLYDLEEIIQGLLEKKTSVILDLFDVGFICSSALGLMLKFTKIARKSGLHFTISGPNEDIKKLFTVTELDKHLLLFDSVAEATKHLEKVQR